MAAQTLGFCATLVGIALGRFAYPPLIPEMIQAGWLTPAEAAQAGAANLVGYCLGAILTLVAPRSERHSLIPTALVFVVISFLACAIPLGLWWMNAWRFVCGMAGAWLMVRGVSAALTAVSPLERARVSGVTFTGIGLGTLLTAGVATALPWIGPTTAWLLMAGLAGLAAMIGLRGWIVMQAERPTEVGASHGVTPRGWWLVAPVLVIGAYAFEAVGIVPHGVFWVDFLVRERGMSQGFAAVQWWIVGFGSLIGPTVIVRMAGRVGVPMMLQACYAATALAVVVPVVTGHPVTLTLSSLVIGALVPGAVSMTSAALAEIAGAAAHARWWAGATVAFAIGQANGAAIMAGWYGRIEQYVPLFVAGAVAAGIAWILALVAQQVPRRLS
ncbi:YbfB/YjiJ family MFS transporter [uncultured Abyssibacter sp.]|uniref:YbfB/YjiJ family MFS transporter n=1 Tax=uncultured Abyssibacter sp. TaxID=2320202 RepID=UPI0032B2E266